MPWYPLSRGDVIGIRQSFSAGSPCPVRVVGRRVGESRFAPCGTEITYAKRGSKDYTVGTVGRRCLPAVITSASRRIPLDRFEL